MMENTQRLSADEQLMQGFAAHVLAWSKQMGAPPASQSLLARLASDLCAATLDGHVCLEVKDLPADDTLADARTRLLLSGVVGTPDAPAGKPLILDEENCLYLHRYYDYENRLAHRLRSMQENHPAYDPVRLRASLNALFGHPEANDRRDWPRLAAALAMQRRLLVISGGPGTGKTTTIVNLIACLIDAHPACRIALAAPTGKAAARMLDALHEHANRLPEPLRQALPTESFTIHRLLGVTPDRRFRHHASNPLPLDVLIVDEASMLDIALATQLFEALPKQARIILLGDKDQLSAVEAGAVFSALSAAPGMTDTCMARLSEATGLPRHRIVPPDARDTPLLPDSVVWFTENFRFAQDSAIGQLAAQISQGNTEAALALLAQKKDPSLTWFNDDAISSEALTQHLQAAYADYLDLLLDTPSDPAVLFAAFDRFRILCAVRDGARGVLAINRQLDRHFRQQLGETGFADEWYGGRPIIVLRNDYALQLYNGDIGIALWQASETGPRLMVCFPDKDKTYRMIAPSRLPEHETAFAMTVHKSQGSEFDSLFLLMPDAPNRVTTRALLYTAVTRARYQVNLCSTENVLRSAIASPTQRHSGLHKRMRGCVQQD